MFGMPIKLWGEENFRVIAKLFGRPLLCSETTLWGGEMSFAKVGVLMDSNKKIDELLRIARSNCMIRVVEAIELWVPDWALGECVNKTKKTGEDKEKQNGGNEDNPAIGGSSAGEMGSGSSHMGNNNYINGKEKEKEHNDGLGKEALDLNGPRLDRVFVDDNTVPGNMGSVQLERDGPLIVPSAFSPPCIPNGFNTEGLLNAKEGGGYETVKEGKHNDGGNGKEGGVVFGNDGDCMGESNHNMGNDDIEKVVVSQPVGIPNSGPDIGPMELPCVGDSNGPENGTNEDGCDKVAGGKKRGPSRSYSGPPLKLWSKHISKRNKLPDLNLGVGGRKNNSKVGKSRRKSNKGKEKASIQQTINTWGEENLGSEFEDSEDWEVSSSSAGVTSSVQVQSSNHPTLSEQVNERVKGTVEIGKIMGADFEGHVGRLRRMIDLDLRRVSQE